MFPLFLALLTLSLGSPVAQKSGLCNVLALSGGGAFGAVEMGILDGLVASGRAPTSYDILTGISAGGLNAGFQFLLRDWKIAIGLASIIGWIVMFLVYLYIARYATNFGLPK